MKKIIITILLLIWISVSNFAYWEDLWSTEITISEKIPGIDCKEWTGIDWKDCIVKIDRDFGSVKSLMAWILKYFTYLSFVFWILFITINWIMISFSWVDSSLKESAKWRIIKTILWLILLSLSWLVLTLVAPWVYK